MDQSIAFERLKDVSDGYGGVTRTWAELEENANVWAEVKAKSGTEAMTEGRMNASYVVVFTIYNRNDLSEKDRIVWQGERYNIRGIRRTGDRSLRLVIEAERGVSE